MKWIETAISSPALPFWCAVGDAVAWAVFAYVLWNWPA